MKRATPSLLVAAALTAIVGTSDAAVIGELGLLDDSANGGINPATGQAWEAGDTYRLVFTTSTSNYSAANTDIAGYNTHVTSVANAAGLSGSWFVIGSTSAADARDNTSTNTTTDGAGVGIFLIDGTTKVADDNADLWDGTLDHAIDIDQDGNTLTFECGPIDRNGFRWHRALQGSWW